MPKRLYRGILRRVGRINLNDMLTLAVSPPPPRLCTYPSPAPCARRFE